MPVADGFTNLVNLQSDGANTEHPPMPNVKAPGGRGKKNGRAGFKLNAFTNLVERTVESLRGQASENASESMRKILVDIRKQYDEVHHDVQRKEQELADVRAEIKTLDAEAVEPPGNRKRAELAAAIKEINVNIEMAAENKKVYEHMYDRMQRELKIVQQKIRMMEEHLARKNHEVVKKQDISRRMQKMKVSGLAQLEAMEQEVELERATCGTALDDLARSVRERQGEIQHRDSFEFWRYEVALEAATDAFQTTLARYQKIYAIEKLTGNCLQKMLFQQAEQSQVTEDGFQKIREVTGLMNVMDIVHKFLHREVEQDLLKRSVGEAEVKLQNLREARAAHPDDTPVSSTFTLEQPSQPPGLQTEVQSKEHILARAHRIHDDIRVELHADAILFEKMSEWTTRVRGLFAKDAEFDVVLDSEQLPKYFKQLDAAVEKMVAKTRQADGSASRLSDKMIYKDDQEWKVIHEKEFAKEFVRFNCRVHASLDPGGFLQSNTQMQQQLKTEEERLELEVQSDREKLKAASRSKAHPSTRPRGEDDGPRQSGKLTAREARDATKATGSPSARAPARPSLSAAGSGAAAVRAAASPRPLE